MLDLVVLYTQLSTQNLDILETIIKAFDDKSWHEDLQKKNSSILYIEFKHVTHDEQDLYDNLAATPTLCRAKT